MSQTRLLFVVALNASIACVASAQGAAHGVNTNPATNPEAQAELPVKEALYEAARPALRYLVSRDSTVAIAGYGELRLRVRPATVFPHDTLRVRVVFQNFAGRVARLALRADDGASAPACPFAVATTLPLAHPLEGLACAPGSVAVAPNDSLALEYTGVVAPISNDAPWRGAVGASVAIQGAARGEYDVTVPVARARASKSRVLRWDTDSAGITRPVFPYVLRFRQARPALDSMAVEAIIKREATARGFIPRSLTAEVAQADDSLLFFGIHVFEMDPTVVQLESSWVLGMHPLAGCHARATQRHPEDSAAVRSIAHFVHDQTFHFPARVCVNPLTPNAAMAVAIDEHREPHAAAPALASATWRAVGPDSDSITVANALAQVGYHQTVTIWPAVPKPGDTVTVRAVWRNQTDDVVRLGEALPEAGWEEGGACGARVDIGMAGAYVDHNLDPCFQVDRAIAPRDSAVVERRYRVSASPGDYAITLVWRTPDRTLHRLPVLIHVARPNEPAGVTDRRDETMKRYAVPRVKTSGRFVLCTCATYDATLARNSESGRIP